MSWGEQQPAASSVQRPSTFAFGLNTTIAPLTDPPMVMQRADEINTILRMLNDAQTSAVMLIGSPGVGKSTLAALLYHRFWQMKQAGQAAPYHLVWLSIGTYTTIPDMIAAILNGIGVREPGFFLLKPDQQISLLQIALRRTQETALVILDQFELLLHPETKQGVAGRGALSLFLELLQTDLGNSRIVLTSYNNPYDQPSMEHLETRIRSCLVSQMSIPEGTALLQQRGVQGSPKEQSLIWQRSGGHTFALVLFSALVHLSGIALSYLLDSPDYQPMWAGEVTIHLITALYPFLNPMQYVLMRVLSLFNEPVPLQGVVMTITGNSAPIEIEQRGRYEHELLTLTRLSLVQTIVNAAGNTCFFLHPLLRQYILEHYLEGRDRRFHDNLTALGIGSPINPTPDGPESLPEALAAGYMRVAMYYLYLVDQSCPPRGQRQGLQDVEPIISATRYLCLGNHWQDACDLLFAQGLHEDMMQWGAWNSLIGLYIALLPPFGTLERHDEGLVCSLVGLIYGRMHEHQQSQAYIEQALTIQREVGDLAGEITTLINCGELLRLRGEHSKARAHFEQASLLNQRQQDVSIQMIVSHNLGLIFQAEKDYKQALSYYMAAMQIAQSHNLPEAPSKGQIYTNLGMLFYEQGMYQEALAILLAALQFQRTQQDPAVIYLERFLQLLEQKMGANAYAQLCQTAIGMQSEVLSRFTLPNMRQ